MTAGEKIFPLILLLASFTLLSMISYHLKILLMTDEKIMIFMPFRLLLKSFEFGEILKIDWNIMNMPKFGDYRKLTIKTNSNFRTNFSDFEFINYDSLEKWIIERTELKLNLAVKQKIELAQAKQNRWWTLIVVLILCVFLILFSVKDKNAGDILIIQSIMILLIVRLTTVFIRYQKRINEFKEKRKA